MKLKFIEKFFHKEKTKLEKVYPWILIIGSLVGLFSAGILTIEKMNLLANPSYVPSCSISPIVACSPVMTSNQASAFGMPNTFIGLSAFAMVLTVGVMLLAGEVKLKKWFWWCFQAGTLFGVLFVTWLMHESLYNLGKLCLYCMAVWAVTIPIFWTTLAWNLRRKNFVVKGKSGESLENHSEKIIIVHFLVLIVLIVTRFSDYFYSLLK